MLLIISCTVATVDLRYLVWLLFTDFLDLVYIVDDWFKKSVTNNMKIVLGIDGPIEYRHVAHIGSIGYF